MNTIKCDDYYILKVRYYGSEYYMKKFHTGDLKAIKNHRIAAEKHNDFFWRFIEKATDNDMDYYFNKFQLSTHDCVREEIHEKFGIIIVGTEGYYKYFLPKNKKNFHLFMWMKKNCECKYKELKKTNTFWLYDKPETRERERVTNFLKNKK